MIGIFVERFDTDNPAGDMASGGGVGDLAAAQPAIIKVMGSREQLQYAHRQCPTALCVYRNIQELEEPFRLYVPSAATADYYWSAIRPRLNGIKFAALTLWPNEPGVSPAELEALNAYWARLAVLARADGYTLAAGGFSAEVRLHDKWQYFKEALKALVENGHYLDQHGYAPDLTTFDGKVVPNPKYEEFLFPWRPLRAALKAIGAPIPNILCGEFGVDSNLTYGVTADGYRTCMSNEQYASELLWADQELRKDNVPAAIYIATRANCPDDQIQYNILLDDSRRNDPNPSVWARIRDSIADVYIPGVVEVPPPPPVEPPPSTGAGPALTMGNDENGKHYLLNLRLTPRNAGTDNLIYPGLPDGFPVVVTGETSGVYSRVRVAFVLSDDGPMLNTTGWLLTKGLKRV